MSETSGTDHCQREDTGLGTGMVSEEMMFLKEQKEVAVENYCFFFFPSLSVSDLYHLIGSSFRVLAFHYPLIRGLVTQNLNYFQDPR